MKKARKIPSGRFDIRLAVEKLSVGVWYGPEGQAKFEEFISRRRNAPFAIGEGDEGQTCGTVMWVLDPSDIRAIVHETHHVAYEAADHIGIHSEEFLAYLQDHLFGRIMDILTKRGHTQWQKHQ